MWPRGTHVSTRLAKKCRRRKIIITRPPTGRSKTGTSLISSRRRLMARSTRTVTTRTSRTCTTDKGTAPGPRGRRHFRPRSNLRRARMDRTCRSRRTLTASGICTCPTIKASGRRSSCRSRTSCKYRTSALSRHQLRMHRKTRQII